MNNDQKTNTIRITCPHCGVVLETDGDIAGTQVNCPECGNDFAATGSRMASASASGKKAWKWWIAGGALLLLLFAWGAGDGKGFRQGKAGKTGVCPVLTYRSVEEYAKDFGRHKTGQYEFNPISESRINAIKEFQPCEDEVVYTRKRSFRGKNLFDWPELEIDTPEMDQDSGLWHAFEVKGKNLPLTGLEEAFIWERIDKFFSGNTDSRVVKNHIFGRTYIWTPDTDLKQNKRFPAPVALSYFHLGDLGHCYLYLNEAGNPSVLDWGRPGQTWFACHEGEEALASYARCLHELDDSFQILAEKHADNCPLPVRERPVIHVGDLEQGFRKRAEVQFDFIGRGGRNSAGTHASFVKQTLICDGWKYETIMGRDELKHKIKQYDKLYSKKAVQNAFDPLYAYLSLRRR